MGRTLVEMLGMLALVGILSVTGIKMFSVAMEKHHVDTLLYEVNKRATTCVVDVNLMNHNPCSLAEYPAQIDDRYPVSVSKINANSFALQVGNVPKDICVKVIAQGLANVGAIYPKNCEETNTMRFLFNAELTAGEENLCHSCPSATPKCCAGFCCECQTDADCTNNTVFGVGYTCQSHMCMESEPPDWCQECLDAGQFCNYNNNSMTEGSCANKTLSPIKTNDGKTYYKASVQTNWYGAKSLCAANNMSLVALDQLCLGRRPGEKCSNLNGAWYWTLNQANAEKSYIAGASQIKGWLKTNLGSSVFPICTP